MESGRPRSRYIKKTQRELRAMRLELQRLWKVRCDAPLLPLDKPFQRGWTRFFVLRKDALRRKDAAGLKQALEFVQCRQFCRKGDFLSYDWKAGRYYDKGHHLRRFSAKGLLALQMPDAVLARFRHQHHGPFSGRRELRELIAIGWGGQFVFRHPEYCLSVTEPHWITHVRVRYPEVESPKTDGSTSPPQRGNLPQPGAKRSDAPGNHRANIPSPERAI